MFLELIRKLKAPICEFEFALSTKRVIGLIGTEESCPMIVEINSNSIDGQTRPSIINLESKKTTRVEKRETEDIVSKLIRGDKTYCFYIKSGLRGDVTCLSVIIRIHV